MALACAMAACGGGDDSSSDTTTSSSTTSSTTTQAASTSSSNPGTTAKPNTTCLVSGLSLELKQGSPGAGQRYATVIFTNTGSQPCTMLGYIGLQLLSNGNTKVPTDLVRNNAPTSTVSIPPGGHAFTTLHWTIIPGQGEPQNTQCEPTPQQAQVTPPNETHSLTEAWPFGEVCQHGQIDTDPVAPGTGT
jgi:hypothetical protein